MPSRGLTVHSDTICALRLGPVNQTRRVMSHALRFGVIAVELTSLGDGTVVERFQTLSS